MKKWLNYARPHRHAWARVRFLQIEIGELFLWFLRLLHWLS